MARTSRKAEVGLVSLEGRQLLSAGTGKVAPDASGSSTPEVRSISYRTNAGARVSVQIFGGNLYGTYVGTDGGLNVVYSGTNAASKLDINVQGGTAPLDSVNELKLAPDDYTGVGGTILGSFLAPRVNLVANGEINMTSGIGRLELGTIGPNTQIHLRDLPPTVNTSTSTASVASTNVTLAANGVSGTGASIQTTTTGNSSATVAANTGSSTVVTAGNGNPVTIPPGETAVAAATPASPIAEATNTEAGKTLTYSNEDGASTLTSVTGYFVPTNNLITTPNPSIPATPPAPPGIVIQANNIEGQTDGSLTIGAGQIWGYDATQNELIRFNTVTGAEIQGVAVGGTPTNTAGLGLGRDGSELVVLLARGTTVQAFDASTGAALGAFSTSDLAAYGLNLVDGVAYTGTTTYLGDSTYQVTYPNNIESSYGVVVSINVTASLAAGTAVTSGTPFYTDDGFSFTGQLTGLAGVNTLFAEGGATFNTFEPTVLQAGVLDLNNAQSTTLKPSTATAFPNPDNTAGVTPYLNIQSAGLPVTGLGYAMGSVDQNLAFDLGVTNGTNLVGLYNPVSLAPITTEGSQAAIYLKDPNKIVALSESFHPELAGTALIDVQGNIQSINVGNVNGLALNDNGNLNQIKFINAENSTVVGQPVSHVIIVKRNNVTIETPARSVGTRNGVLIIPTLRPLGPLSLPD